MPDIDTPLGFPSPATDFIDKSLCLNELLVKNKTATYFMEADTSQWQNEGINLGDILVIDRSLKPVSGDKVVIIHESDFALRDFNQLRQETVFTAPSPILFESTHLSHDFTEIWGVITSIIHRIK